MGMTEIGAAWSSSSGPKSKRGMEREAATVRASEGTGLRVDWRDRCETSVALLVDARRRTGPSIRGRRLLS
jgi:hypothetical protein